jgi:hypothetical protein
VDENGAAYCAEWEREKGDLGFEEMDLHLPYFIHGEVKITDSFEIAKYISSRWGEHLLGTTPETKANVTEIIS